MSERVVELPSQGARPSPEFERTPPQDVAAEQSVLGGMLLSKDAIADVVEVVRATDFYRPAHQTIFDVVVDLYGKGEPADPITVSAELTRLGEIGRVGGAPYLHTLLSSVPTAANAGFYARIVAEQAILRRLVEAGTRIVQLGYGAAGAGGVDDVVDRAQQSIYDVTERRSSEDYTLLEELMQPTMDELEAIGSRGGSMSGVPTGFVDLDGLTNGLHPGQLIVIAGRPGLGKALALDTALPTPTGWTTMGQVAVGDCLLDADGRPTRVVGATDVMTGRPCFEVVFSDGTRVVADADHQWLTHAGGPRGAEEQVRTTAQLAAAVGSGRTDRQRLAVRTAAALQLPDAELPHPPYALGVGLGRTNACREVATADDAEIAMQVESEQPTPPPLVGRDGEQHVPIAYLRASESQRRALLTGLMDVNGTVTSAGDLQLAVPGGPLARDVHELVVSLGHRCVVTTERPHGPIDGVGTSHNSVVLTWATDERMFRLERKHLLHKERSRAATAAGAGAAREITSVTPVPSVPVRCVEVDNPDHLYLATRSMVPTHNSTLGLDIARAASVKHGMPSAIFSLEMSKTEITMRLLSAEARVPLHHMRAGTMTDDDWARLARRMGEVAEAPLYIDDSPNLTMMEIRAKARRLRQRNDLQLIVIDYLQLMSGNKKAESRQQEVSELSRSLKLLAKELEVPVIAMSQLNRGAEARTDKKPQISDLRESGCLPASTRVLRADTGGEVTLGELFASGARDVPVWSLDDSLRYVRRHLTHVFPTGRKAVFELRLASGKRITATANHPFLTYDGWRPLGELGVGSRVAVPRHVPAPELVAHWSDEQVVEHAHRAAAGGQQPSDAATVAHLPKRQIRLFLRTLWQQSGSSGTAQPPWLHANAALLEDVSRLLLRFGISVQLAPGRDALRIVETADRKRFLTEIALAGRSEGPLVTSGAVPPRQVWQRVHEVLAVRTAVPGAVVPLATVQQLLSSDGLDLEATNDVLWDEVVAVQPVGEQDVFDATILGTHNFIADGVAVHNSIEQDADVVILLHREDAYEKESPRAGEADFIVAKHRNGPTATITVAFQGHYSRFVDMNPG